MGNCVEASGFARGTSQMPPYDPSDTEPLYHTYIRFQAIPQDPSEKAYRLQDVTSVLCL